MIKNPSENLWSEVVERGQAESPSSGGASHYPDLRLATQTIRQVDQISHHQNPSFARGSNR